MLMGWNPFNDMMEGFQNSIGEGLGNLIAQCLTAWLGAPEPNLHDDYVMWMRDRLSFFVATSVMISIFVAAYRMALTQKWENLGELAKSIATLLAVSVVSTGILTTTIRVTDVFSHHVINGSLNLEGAVNGTGATIVSAQLTNIILTELLTSGIGSAAGMLILLFAVLVNIILFILLLGRDAVVILLVGILPLAASSTNTKMGKQWFDKILAWLIAFVLFKPTAALIYAMSFRILSKFHGFSSLLVGLCLWVFALIALPALMRLIVPATSAMSMGNPAAMIAGAVATGVMLKSGLAGGGGFGSGPSGATTGGGGAPPPPPSGGGGGGGAPPPPPPTGGGSPSGTSNTASPSPPPPSGGGGSGSPAPGPPGTSNSAVVSMVPG